MEPLTRLPPRVRRDAELCPEIHRDWEENFRAYGARNVWRQLKREKIRVARCTVERLISWEGLEGIVRGAWKRTTTASDGTPKPLDRVQRQFVATRPDELWIADFTYVVTWAGFVYVAFVIDVFARRIVGQRVSRSMVPEVPNGYSLGMYKIVGVYKETASGAKGRSRRTQKRPGARLGA